MATLSFVVFASTFASFLLVYWTGQLLQFENQHTFWQWNIGFSLILVSTILKPDFLFHLSVNVAGAALLGFSLVSIDEMDPKSLSSEERLLSSPPFWYLVLVTVIGLAVLVRLPSIFEYGLRWDEHWHVSTVVGYLRDGVYATWSFQRGTTADGRYLRAWFYTWQVIQLTQWLRKPLFAARIVSLCWGLLTFVPMYLLALRLNIGRTGVLICLVWGAVSPYMITVSRWGRFYSFSLFLVLSMVYLFYRFWYDLHGPVRVLYGTLTMGLFVLGCHVNPVTLAFLPAVIVFLLLELDFRTVNDMYVKIASIVSGIISVIIVGGLLIVWDYSGTIELIVPRTGTGELTDSLTIVPQQNFRYLLYFCQDHIGYGFAAVLLASLVTPLVWNHSFRRYLYVMTFVPLLLIVLFADRTPQVRYLLTSLALSIPLFIALLLGVPNRIGSGHGKIHLVVLVGLFALLVYEFPARTNYIYSGNYGYIHSPGIKTPKYRSALTFLRNRARSDQYVLTYYWNYFYYVHPMYRVKIGHENSTFNSFHSDTKMRKQVKRIGNKFSGVWVMYPEVLDGLISRGDRRFLKTECESIRNPARWYVRIYFCG